MATPSAPRSAQLTAWAAAARAPRSAQCGEHDAAAARAQVTRHGPGRLTDRADQFVAGARREQAVGGADHPDRAGYHIVPGQDGRRDPGVADGRLLVLDRVAALADLR